MTRIDLKITGTVESLHLEPGDRILVTIDRPYFNREHIEYLHGELSAKFPGHEIVMLSGLRLAVEQAA